MQSITALQLIVGFFILIGMGFEMVELSRSARRALWVGLALFACILPLGFFDAPPVLRWASLAFVSGLILTGLVLGIRGSRREARARSHSS